MGTLGWDLPRHQDDSGADPCKECGDLPGKLTEEPGVDGGLELELGGVLGVFGLWRLASSELAQASPNELHRYDLVLQSMKALSDTGSQTGLVFGIRLAVGR